MIFSKWVQDNLADIEQELIEHKDEFNLGEERLTQIVAGLRLEVSDKKEENIHYLAQQLMEFRQELWTVLIMDIQDHEDLQGFEYDNLESFFKLVKNTQRAVEHQVLKWEAERQSKRGKNE